MGESERSEVDVVGLRAARETAMDALRSKGLLWPVLDIHGCPRCFSPRRSDRGVCSTCFEVGLKNPLALDSLEAITVATVTGGLEPILASCKDRPGHRGDVALLQLAVPLTAYLERHRDALELEVEETLFTAVPSSSNVIARALSEGVRLGWFNREIEPTGESLDPNRRQRHRDKASRQSLTHAAWSVEAERVRNRNVVLLDDLMTTGASLHSYAKALKLAGARRIRGVVLIRHVSGSVYEEGLEMRRSRGSEPLWSPDRRWKADLTGLG